MQVLTMVAGRVRDKKSAPTAGQTRSLVTQTRKQILSYLECVITTNCRSIIFNNMMLMVEGNALTPLLVHKLTLVKVSCSMSSQSGSKTIAFFFILAIFYMSAVDIFELTLQTQM